MHEKVIAVHTVLTLSTLLVLRASIYLLNIKLKTFISLLSDIVF